MEATFGTGKSGLRLGGLGAISQAAARYGWQGLARRVAEALRSGGPTLLLRKARVHWARAKNASRGGGEIRLVPGGLERAHASPSRAKGHCDATYTLDEKHSLPLARFNKFMENWSSHPAIRQVLTSDRAVQSPEYTVVIAPHSRSGFARLSDSLVLVRHLAERANMAVRVVVYGADTAPTPAGIDVNDPLVKVVFVNSADDLRRLLEGGGPRHLAQFLICGDQICPVYAEILSRSVIADYDLILTDMYFVDAQAGAHPILLPGINPVHALNTNYFLSRSIMNARVAAEELAKLSTLDTYELTTAVLGRCVDLGTHLKAYHIAFPMVCIAETRDTMLQSRAASLARKTPLRLAFEGSPPSSPAPRSKPRVSVVICTKDNGFLLEQLVERLWSSNARDLVDIVVVANRTENPYALQIHQTLDASGRIKLIQYDYGFNFSAQCNLGAAAAGGEVLLFLNDDIVPVNADWLAELIAPLERPEIGVVGPLLLYPDQTVQHAGMFLGFNDIAGHALRGAQLPDGDYCFTATAPRQVMAVTGAVLVMRRKDFESLNGFDQNLFALHIQDVDLCLRAHFSGLAVVYNPRSVLIHMESISIKPTLTDPRIAKRRAGEHAAFLERWGDVLGSDQFHNPNFSRTAEDFRLLVPPRS